MQFLKEHGALLANKQGQMEISSLRAVLMRKQENEKHRHSSCGQMLNPESYVQHTPFWNYRLLKDLTALL